MQRRKSDRNYQNKNSFAGFLKTAVFGASLLLGALAVFFIAPNIAQAQEALDTLNNANLAIETTRDLRDIIARILQGVFGFLGLIAVILVLYGGWTWMTSAGNPEKIERAKNILKNAGIGLAIIILAYSITAFIFYLLGVGGGPGGLGAFRGPRGGVGGLGGALGNGPIQSHFPLRDARDVPRNASIIVTFKEEMDLATMIKDTSLGVDGTVGDGIYGNCETVPNGPGEEDDVTTCDSVNNTTDDNAIVANVLILTREDFDNENYSAALSDVNVQTEDGKTFVFDPRAFLGNPTSPAGYVVILGGAILKANGTAAFTSGNPPGYAWAFEVSNKIDIDPPTVVSVIPTYTDSTTPGVPRNMIIQMNFSEAVNPITVSGIVDGVGDDFNKILIQDSTDGTPSILNGKFEISNQYRTVEFTTDVECGTNSCGEKIYCLPASAKIEALIKSAGLASLGRRGDQPFLAQNAGSSLAAGGVADVSDNALDGNADGEPDGNSSTYNLNIEDPIATRTANPAGDNFQWSFFTNNVIDLIPPTIIGYAPVAGAVSVDPSQAVTATFDKFISSSTVRPDSSYGDGYCGCRTNNDCYNGSGGEEDRGEICDTVKGQCVSAATSEKITCYRYQEVVPGQQECRQHEISETIDGVVTTFTGDDVKICIEKEHVTLEQAPDANAVAYWLNVTNSEDPLVTESTVVMGHVNFLENLSYGVSYGSAIKSLTQNCYIPSAGPGCPRAGTSVETFGAGAGWLGTYPSCDLTRTTLTNKGAFNLAYLDSSGDSKITAGSSFAWDTAIADLYKERMSGSEEYSAIDTLDYFKTFTSPNTLSLMVYHFGGSYYLVGVGGKYNNTNVTDPIKTYEFEITSPNGTVNFDAAGLDAVDEEAVVTVTPGTAGKISAKLEWPSNSTSGFVYKIGSSENFSLKLTPINLPTDLNTLPLLRVVYPGGVAALPSSTGFELLTVDRVSPVASTANFKVQYRQEDSNYIVKVSWNAGADGQTDINEAYFDLNFNLADAAAGRQYSLEGQRLFDDGTNGDTLANDNIWTYWHYVPSNAVAATDINAASVILTRDTKDYAGNPLQANISAAPAILETP